MLPPSAFRRHLQQNSGLLMVAREVGRFRSGEEVFELRKISLDYPMWIHGIVDSRPRFNYPGSRG
jgi:hypothetical protein